MSQEKLEQMFSVFDKNQDGYIDREEFQFCWNHWIKTVMLKILLNFFWSNIDKKCILLSRTQIVRPINAFLVVDVQNDFISGTLNISNCSAQQNGLEVC